MIKPETMPSSRSSHSRSSVLVAYPPPPCVEEEPTSLARELHGLTKLGEKPGFEGTRVRGAVDQYPVILNTGSPGSSSSSPLPDVSNVPGLGNVSSDDSSGPVTPPPMVQEPAIRTSTRPQSHERSRHTSSSASSASSASSWSRGQPSHIHHQSSRDTIPQRHSRPPPHSRDSITKNELPAPLAVSSSSDSRGRPLPALPRHPDSEVNFSRQPQPPAHSRDSRAFKHEAPIHTIPYGSRGARPERPRSRSRGPVNERAHPSQSAPPTSQSNTVRSGSTGDQRSSVHDYSRRESPPGYMSDSNAARNRASSYHPPSAPRVPEKIPLENPTSPTLAERIEEKLRQRQERRDSGVSSDTEARSRATTVTIKPGESILNAAIPASAPISPSRDPHASGRPLTERAPASRPRAATVSSAPPPTLSRSMSKASERPKSILVNGNQSGLSQVPRTPGSVKFQDLPTEKPTTFQAQAQVQGQVPAPSRQTSPPQRPPNPTGLCITPCPRSAPTAGQTDWYTLKGLTHLDICPSCMGQIAHSRFRDFFIPSLAKPPTQKTRCAFANPWTRLSWTQMIKKKHDSLEMLYQMTRPPPGTRACPGRVITNQTWYRIVDPETNIYLPRFHICGTCARNVRVLMPALRDTFQHCPEPQERACDFVTTSPRFVQFIDLLDDASSRAEADPSRRPDVREFLNYARRKVVLRDCRRDRPTLGAWHYIPSLPELSVCEDCYDEVVWPLAKSNRPIARMFCTSMRLLPGDGPRSCREASCQLYSARMRARFRDAVAKDDFAELQSVALRRYEAERRFKDRREELLVAEGKGYDCDEEMRKAVGEWRRWE